MKPLSTSIFGILTVLAACGPHEAPVSESTQESGPAIVEIQETEATEKLDLRYSLTESLDGTIRVFAAEKGDETWLYEMRLQNGQWTSPERMDVPGRMLVQGPSFSRQDGALYFASDAELEVRPGRKDLNIWRMPLRDGAWGEPVPLEGDVNTGANETMAAISSDGLMVFVSNHSRMGGGGYDLGEARQDDSGAWVFQRALDELNDVRANDHICLTDDGQYLFFYSHRQPKLGVVDIWISQRQEDDQWSEPINPGPPMSTPIADFGAGLSGDGKTLFFSRGGKLMRIPIDSVLP
jgi:hypothetical protein